MKRDDGNLFSIQDLKVLFHNILNNFSKLFKDLCVLGCSVFIYAAYGQNFTEILGEIIFAHFIIILLIVLLINIIITIITKIIKKLLNPTGAYARYVSRRRSNLISGLS